MQRIRVTDVNGHMWTHELGHAVCNVGRETGSDLVLRDDPGVSSEHCLLELDGGAWIVKDRGSANGTYINNGKLTEPTQLQEGDRLYVGSYLLELVSIAPEAPVQPGGPRPRGPVRRMTDPTAKHRRSDEQLQRWATDWDQADRPGRLLLRGASLKRAIERATQAPQRFAQGQLLGAFLQASRRRAGRSTVLRVLGAMGVVGVVVSVALLVVWLRHVGADAELPQDETTPDGEAAIVAGGAGTPEPAPAAATWVDHAVIPAETLEDVARRYGVPIANVARWNRLNPDDPQLEVGQTLRVKPKANPLPQQQIVYELERGYDWRKLSKRFAVPVDKLRAYNPELGSKLKRGMRVNVWIDPKPYGRRRGGLEIPEFRVRPDAIAVGRPNDGRLEKGIQMPKSDLYVRRAPFIMWGSSHTIQNLQTAIASFRQEVDFDGVLVVADLSQRRGGHFPPHKSHQAGRDVDVWMPTLKGVYRRSHLGKDRKPLRNEIDFFALWGLIRALINTDEVLHVFIEYELQGKVYRAAKLMGATDDELAAAMQWPRGRYARGILGHSAGHVAHIHVRFKCGPLETQCSNSIARE